MNKKIYKLRNNLMFISKLQILRMIVLLVLIILSFVDKSTRVFAGLGVFVVIIGDYLNMKLAEYKKKGKLKAYLNSYFYPTVIGFFVLIFIFVGIPIFRKGCNASADSYIVGLIAILCIFILVLFFIGVVKEMKNRKSK